MSHKKWPLYWYKKFDLDWTVKSLKLDSDMKNIPFGFLSTRILTLKQSVSFWKLAKIGQK